MHTSLVSRIVAAVFALCTLSSAARAASIPRETPPDPCQVLSTFAGGEFEATVNTTIARDGTATTLAAYGFLGDKDTALKTGGQLFRITSASAQASHAAGLLLTVGAVTGRTLADTQALLKQAGLDVRVTQVAGERQRGALDANQSAHLVDLFSSTLESTQPGGPVSHAFSLGASALGLEVQAPTGVCPNNCGGEGVCHLGKCFCYQGFTGADCTTPVACKNDCSGNGVCLHGVCSCYPGASGDDCSVGNACPNGCNGNGVCAYGKCFCDPGFAGAACGVATGCPQDCNDHGRCAFGKCFCDPGFTGVACGVSTGCPDNCSGNGVCAYGKCFCDPGFTGDNCAANTACASKCSGHGVCQAGRCFCEPGYVGTDCQTPIACPNDCSGHGVCNSGVCACFPNYQGNDCGVVIINCDPRIGDCAP